ncbi:MAG: M50 family metallopeptidase [Lachnospiraceae bacterium]|nr:M50 family metallopeptidase [Lachnospiraceae bacterium]
MKKFSIVFSYVIFMLAGGIFGVALIEFFGFHELNMSDKVLFICISLVYLYIALMFNIIVHEAGHLVAGLMSGYKFASFRVGSFMLKKEEEKLVLKRFTLAGTGGQCLMAPPDLVDGKIPFVFYNIGGALANLITFVVSIILMFVTKDVKLLSLLFFITALIGLMLALSNGVPMRSGEVDNDGMNIISLSKDPLAMKALWVQLKINECTSKNISLRDMDDEWFELPENADMKNVLISSIAAFKCNKLMAERKFEETKKAIDALLNSNAVIVGIYQTLLKLDKAYIEMISNNNKVLVDALIEKQDKNIIMAMKNFPSVIRYQYTYALLIDKDTKKAAEYRKHMEFVKKNYPYMVDVEDELELMNLADEVLSDRENNDNV